MALVNYLAWCLGTCRLAQIREDKLRFSHKCSEDDGIVGLRSIKSSSGSSSSTGTSSLLLTGICKWARSQAFEKKPRCCLLPPLFSSFLRNSTDLLACPKTGCKLVFFPEHMNQFVQKYKVFHRSADLHVTVKTHISSDGFYRSSTEAALWCHKEQKRPWNVLSNDNLKKISIPLLWKIKPNHVLAIILTRPSCFKQSQVTEVW